MSAKTKRSRQNAYKMIGLCVGALILGCLLPLLPKVDHSSLPNTEVVVMEAVSAAALVWVFGLYVLKK